MGTFGEDVGTLRRLTVAGKEMRSVSTHFLLVPEFDLFSADNLVPDQDGTDRLRECPPARAVARFLPLDFAQTANPILALRGGCATRRTPAACPSRQAVPGGGRFCVAAEKIGSGPGA
jgi:hypothetical protein